MADNTIGWGQGSVNNTNDWGKGKANSTNDWGSIYANSPSGDTNIEGGSAGTDFTTNLVASYNFDTDFTDYTGNNDLTANGDVIAGVTGGKVSDCAEFDGNGDYAVTSDSSDFSFANVSEDIPFTIGFWVKFNSVGNRQTIIMRRGTSAQNGGWQLDWDSSNKFRLILADQSSINNRLTATFPLTPVIGTWYNIVYTYDASATIGGIKGYLNGVSQTITDESAGTYTQMPYTDENITIGTESFDLGDKILDGLLDELHVWKNRELSSAEVLEIYNTENGGTSILPALPSPTGLLADYPNAAAAYSLRNLISTNTNVVRVRRSSDNAEQDFSATEITDGTLTTFTGANDGFVTTWYDQSGNSNNASQSTAASQPKIVNSGTVISENSKSAIEMDGVNDFLTVPYSSELNVQIASSTVVAVYRKSAGFRVMQTNLNGTGVGSNYWFLDGSSILSVAGAYTTSYPYNQDVQKLELATWDGNLIFNYRNGVKMIPNSVSNGTIVNGGINPLYSPTSNTAGFLIGKRDFSSTGIMTGKFQEIIIYDSDQTLNKSGIETNINNHYSIY